MFSRTLAIALLASAAVVEAGSAHIHNHVLMNKRQNADASATELVAAAIQTGSFLDGSGEIGSAEVGQAKSLTSQNNFINNCAGKTLTNGLQIITGSCNGIIMGDIPAKTAMVSSIITFPIDASATIQSDTTFNITVQMANLVAGSFTNADATYYAAPQTLSGGKVVGHTHVTVQDLGNSLNPTTALDPTQFAFFKGINDAGNGEGLLSATVTGGLPAGNYRVCTLASASNHQPVLMPVAQRGTSDDCSKFTVVGSGTTANAASNNGAKGVAAAALAASAVLDPGNTASASATVDSKASASSSALSVAPFANSTTKADKGKGGNAASTTAKAAEVSSSTSEVAATQTTEASGIKAVGNSNSGSKGSSSGSSGSNSGSNAVVVEKVTVIETLFVFVKSLGGLPPSVGKSEAGDESFVVQEQTFQDFESAANAACGIQFTACSSFSGAGFSVEECITQKDSCVSAVSTASTSVPATITGTATLPLTASVTGSILASSIVTLTNTAVAAKVTPASSPSLAASNPSLAASNPSPVAADIHVASSACLVVTNTVFVDRPTATKTADVAASTPSSSSRTNATPSAV